VWYNSYCSQVELAVHEDGVVKGVYTSHTGSTGSSDAVGYVGKPISNREVTGTPVSLAIKWRLINEDAPPSDRSSHWVSNMAGQYNPAQTIKVSGQQPYSIDETLYMLNELNATAAASDIDEPPRLLPQDLIFHKAPPSYCEPITPPARKPYTPTAKDLISGKWKNIDGDILNVSVNKKDFSVSGNLITSDRRTYKVLGQADPIAGNPPLVPQQGITLAVKNEAGNILALVGGVNIPDGNRLELWKSELRSTTWITRYKQLTFDKQDWIRQ
ncbi:MAG: hypothetical protein D3908_10385, partial [Candidatus Electrothrix sp. AUS4]|nr:hypothetical protein [Candidatus Electrothrix sp. AUS4]